MNNCGETPRDITCYLISTFVLIFLSFLANSGAVSDEHGERFHQDASTKEKR